MTLRDLSATQDALSPPGATNAPAACESVLAQLWDYLDGNCSAGVAGRIVAHIAVCSPCSRRLLMQEQFFASLAVMRERWTAPAGLHEAVRKAVGAEGRRYRQN